MEGINFFYQDFGFSQDFVSIEKKEERRILRSARGKLIAHKKIYI